MGKQKVALTQAVALHGTPFFFHFRRVPSGFTKKRTFLTAHEGLLTDPNIIEVSIANQTKNTNKLPLSLFSGSNLGARARWCCRVNTNGRFMWQEYVLTL